MGRWRFLFWTIAALLALVFFYTFSSSKVYKVKIVGDDDFERAVKEALGREHLRFEISKEADVVFDQRKMEFRMRNEVFHLSWSDEVRRRAFEDGRCDGCELFPVVEGKIDERYEMVLEECARMMKGRTSRLFQKGWLVAKMGVFKDGKLLFIYDPLTESKEYFGGGEE